MEVTDGTTTYNADHYRISTFYDLAKRAINRLAYTLGHELGERDATAVAVTPGWLRSEMMLEAFDTDEQHWQDAPAPPGFATSESPRYIGRAIAALAADSDHARWNQQSVTVGTLARHYDVTDIDGSRPDAWSYMAAADADPDADPRAFR